MPPQRWPTAFWNPPVSPPRCTLYIVHCTYFVSLYVVLWVRLQNICKSTKTLKSLFLSFPLRLRPMNRSVSILQGILTIGWRWWLGRCGGWKRLLHSSISPASAWALGGWGRGGAEIDFYPRNLFLLCLLCSLSLDFPPSNFPGRRLSQCHKVSQVSRHPIVAPTKCEG